MLKEFIFLLFLVFTLFVFLPFSDSLTWTTGNYTINYITNYNQFDQGLNTTDSVEFVNITADYFFGSGANLYDINSTGGTGNPFDQTLNTTSNATFYNVTLQNINVTNDINIGQRIIFAFNELIDNIVDGWLRITGSLNVTENVLVSGNLNATNVTVADRYCLNSACSKYVYDNGTAIIIQG